jgi:GT2 family glycosyltransferase
MTVGVVIPSFNQVLMVEALLRQLREIPEFETLQVTVVDNGSTDETSERVARQFPEVHLIRLHENGGGSGGFIAGMEYALSQQPDVIWLLDDDVELNTDTLSNLLKAAQSLVRDGSRWGAIGALMADLKQRDRVTEAGARLSWLRCRFELSENGARVSSTSKAIRKVQYCSAACLLIHPESVRRIGGFENIFLHGDDVDWCLRSAAAGFPVFCAPAAVFYHPSSKPRPALWVRYYDARNMMWLWLTYKRAWAFWGMACLLLKGVYFWLHRMPQLARLYFIGVADAFSGRLRARGELDVESLTAPGDATEGFEGKRICVFHNVMHYRRACRCFPELVGGVNRVFFYESVFRRRTFVGARMLGRLIVAIRSSLVMGMHPRTSVIFDGACLQLKMVPPLLNPVCYVFPQFGKVLLSARGEGV